MMFNMQRNISIHLRKCTAGYYYRSLSDGYGLYVTGFLAWMLVLYTEFAIDGANKWENLPTGMIGLICALLFPVSVALIVTSADYGKRAKTAFLLISPILFVGTALYLMPEHFLPEQHVHTVIIALFLNALLYVFCVIKKKITLAYYIE